MSKSKYLLGVLVFIIAGGLYFTWQADKNEQKGTKQAKQGGQIGNMAPDFSLKTPDGQMIKLSDFRGKRVVLNFWATWCPPCKAEVPEFERFHKEYHGNGIEILAVDITAQEKNKEDVNEFIKKYGITYPVALDETGTTADTYRISAIPTTYIIDAQGRIRQKVIGALEYQALSEALAKLNE